MATLVQLRRATTMAIVQEIYTGELGVPANFLHLTGLENVANLGSSSIRAFI